MSNPSPKKKREDNFKDLEPEVKFVEEFFEGVDAHEKHKTSETQLTLSQVFRHLCPYMPKASDGKRTAWISGWLEARAEHILGPNIHLHKQIWTPTGT